MSSVDSRTASVGQKRAGQTLQGTTIKQASPSKRSKIKHSFGGFRDPDEQGVESSRQPIGSEVPGTDSNGHNSSEDPDPFTDRINHKQTMTEIAATGRERAMDKEEQMVDLGEERARAMKQEHEAAKRIFNAVDEVTPENLIDRGLLVAFKSTRGMERIQGLRRTQARDVLIRYCADHLSHGLVSSAQFGNKNLFSAKKTYWRGLHLILVYRSHPLREQAALQVQTRSCTWRDHTLDVFCDIFATEHILPQGPFARVSPDEVSVFAVRKASQRHSSITESAAPAALNNLESEEATDIGTVSSSINSLSQRHASNRALDTSDSPAFTSQSAKKHNDQRTTITKGQEDGQDSPDTLMEEGEIHDTAISGIDEGMQVAGPAIKLKDLSEDDKALQERYWGLTNGEDLVRCLRCDRTGHMAVTCPSRRCSHCGTPDAHISTACPIARKCQRCGERGHSKDACQSKLARTHDDGSSCDFCHENHLEENCSWLWRTFKPNEQPCHKVNSILVYCYECGLQGHFGDDCIIRPKTKASNSDIFSARFAQQFVKEQIRSTGQPPYDWRLPHRNRRMGLNGRTSNEGLGNASAFFGEKVSSIRHPSHIQTNTPDWDHTHGRDPSSSYMQMSNHTPVSSIGSRPYGGSGPRSQGQNDGQFGSMNPRPRNGRGRGGKRGRGSRK